MIIWIASFGFATSGLRGAPAGEAADHDLAGCHAPLLLGLLMAYVLARPWLSLLLAGVMIICLGGTPRQPGWPPRDWVLVACDVGQGDGIAITDGRQQGDRGGQRSESGRHAEAAWTGWDHPGAIVDHHAFPCRPCRRTDRRAATPSRWPAVGEPASTARTSVGDCQARGHRSPNSGEARLLWVPEPALARRNCW